jgi:ADP-ribosylglycohydrolase
MVGISDKIIGSLCLGVIGDCLGIPFEFYRAYVKIDGKKIYTRDLKLDGEILMERVYMVFGGKGYSKECTLYPYLGSDDTQMTLLLLTSILDNGLTFNRDDVLKRYMGWANTKGVMMGNNTKALFQGVRQITGYDNRMKKIDDMDTRQSNGSLMRCMAMSLLKCKGDFKEYETITLDTRLTNDNNVNVQCTYIYIKILRQEVFGGGEVKDIEKIFKDIDMRHEIRVYVDLAIRDIIVGIDDVVKINNKNNISMNTKNHKGWVVYSLYIALITYFYHSSTIAEAYSFIFENFSGGDMDTILLITFVLVGANLGHEKMLRESIYRDNLQKILNVDNKPVDVPTLNIELIDRLRSTFD